MSYHRGSEIIVSADPRGCQLEGTIAASETPRPGTIVQIQASAGLDDGGRPTWEIYNADADGGRPKGPLGILLPAPGMNTWDLNTTAYTGTTEEYIYSAYAAGDRCHVYVPIPGEEFNLLIADVSGSADQSFGQIMIVDDTTGQLIDTTGTPETEMFMLMVTMPNPIGGPALGHVIYTGY